MGDAKRMRRRKARLHRLNGGRCHWCGIVTVISPRGRITVQTPNTATLDHLDERFSGRRGEYSGQERTVLACAKCNSHRSNANLPIEERRKRATH